MGLRRAFDCFDAMATTCCAMAVSRLTASCIIGRDIANRFTYDARPNQPLQGDGMLGKKYVVAILITLLGSGSVPAVAADCVLNVTRTACPGQESESFSKCDGKASCVEKKPVADAASCAAEATAACANSRKTVTKNKTVTAQFNGSAVEGGKNFCAGHPDYPYAAKQDCK